MELSAAIRNAFGDMRQEDVGEAIGESQQTISNWASGRVKQPPLEGLRRIEEVCGRPRGYILRLANFAEPAITVEDAIDNDPKLSDPARDALKAFYRAQLRGD